MTRPSRAPLLRRTAFAHIALGVQAVPGASYKAVFRLPHDFD